MSVTWKSLYRQETSRSFFWLGLPNRGPKRWKKERDAKYEEKKHINNTNRYGMPHQANRSTHTQPHTQILSFAQSFAHHITPLILCFAYRRRNIVLLSCCLHFHSLRLKSHKLWLHQQHTPLNQRTVHHSGGIEKYIHTNEEENDRIIVSVHMQLKVFSWNWKLLGVYFVILKTC